MLPIVIWLVKHVVAPLLIYMIVSAYAISLGVDPTLATIIAAACGFGTLVVTFKFGF